MIGTAARSSTRPTGPSLAQLSPLRPTRLSRRLVPAMQTRQKPWPCKVARPSQQPTSDEDAFATMKAAMPTCLANLITSPSGLRGLTASRSLQQGEVILFVPHTHTVSVPTGMTTHPSLVGQSLRATWPTVLAICIEPESKRFQLLSQPPSLSQEKFSPPCAVHTSNPRSHFAPHVCGVHAGGAKSVAQWEMQFLQPWQAKHRPLPPALVGFLAGKCWSQHRAACGRHCTEQAVFFR